MRATAGRSDFSSRSFAEPKIFVANARILESPATGREYRREAARQKGQGRERGAVGGRPPRRPQAPEGRAQRAQASEVNQSRM
jgi:hypothetical protein